MLRLGKRRSALSPRARVLTLDFAAPHQISDFRDARLPGQRKKRSPLRALTCAMRTYCGRRSAPPCRKVSVCPAPAALAKAGVVQHSTADDASMDRVTPSTFGDRTVGGVRLDRISRPRVPPWGATSGGYELGNDYLNVAIVEVLGIDRSQGVGAFGPFVTLLALSTQPSKSCNGS